MRLVIGTAIVAGIAICASTRVAVIPALQGRAKVRPIAAQIDALVPESEPLYAVDPDYQPFLFYIRSRLIYVSRVDEMPASARYVLIQPARERRGPGKRALGPAPRAQPLTRDGLSEADGGPDEGRGRRATHKAVRWTLGVGSEVTQLSLGWEGSRPESLTLSRLG